jgi:hypothetical protein
MQDLALIAFFLFIVWMIFIIWWMLDVRKGVWSSVRGIEDVRLAIHRTNVLLRELQSTFQLAFELPEPKEEPDKNVPPGSQKEPGPGDIDPKDLFDTKS